MMASRCVALTLGIVVMVAWPGFSAKGENQAPPPNPVPLTADLERVSNDCAGLISIDLGSIRKKFDLNEKAFLTRHFVNLSNTLGAPLLDLSRVTVVFPGEENALPYALILGQKPLPKEAILKALCPKNEQTQVGGKTVYQHDSSALAFVSDHLLVTGPTEAVKRMLAGPVPPRSPAMQGVLAKASTHDVTLWANQKAMPTWEQVTRLGLQGVLANLNFGKTIDLRVQLECASEAKVQTLLQNARGGVNLVRGQFLMMAGVADTSDLIPDTGIDLKHFPMELIRRAEQGLGTTSIRAEKTTVTLTTSLPIEAKFLHAELEKLGGSLKQMGIDCEGGLPIPLVINRYESAPTLVQQTPPVNPSGPPGPATYGKAPVVYPDPSLPPPHPAQIPVVIPPASIPTAPTTGGLVPASATRVVEPAKVKWTIANLRKEEVVLFQVSPDGKMDFSQKIPAGEAADVTSAPLGRWVAFTAGVPSAETFEARADAVWLLRPTEPTLPRLPEPPADRPSSLQRSSYAK